MIRKLRIAIDCRITDPRQGVGTAFLALAKALAESPIEDQEYTFIVREELKDWLTPFLHGRCRVHGIPNPKPYSAKQALGWIAPLKWLWQQLYKLRWRFREDRLRIPVSDGYVEAEQFDVVHFPAQMAYLTSLPTIYQPWDLQHLHYPAFFSKDEIRQRELCYRAFSEQAAFVCVQAEWTRQDVIEKYGLMEEKVEVIPWGAVFDAYEGPTKAEIDATTAKYALPQQFFLYPAVTWKHKNHELIFRALELLNKVHGIAPHVFFTGAETDYKLTLEKIAHELAVAGQVHFLGFVSTVELQALFQSATAMIFPSKFEGFGLPILEAFHARLPVIGSNATTLPEVARDGAMSFDPDSPEELADCMREILQHPELRQEMIKKGSHVLSQFSIAETAARFQKLYARVAALAQTRRSAAEPILEAANE